jgi:hypothetical protein
VSRATSKNQPKLGNRLKRDGQTSLDVRGHDGMRRAPVSCPGALLGVAAPSYGPTCRTKTLAGSDPWVMVKNAKTADPSEPSPT